MKTSLVTLATAALLAAASVQAQPANSSEPAVRAADAFLASLSAEQRKQVLFNFNDTVQRARWSNFPTGFVPRSGISFKQMNPAQRAAALQLLASVLSPMGLQKVNEIRLADDDFKVNGSKRGPGGRGSPPPGAASGPRGASGPGGPGAPGSGRRPPALSGDMFGSDLYYFSILGKPSSTEPWMLQFGGHHLAMNITIAGDQGVLAPTLTGAQPATFVLNGKTIRPLARESDKALVLLKSLSATQRQRAVLGYTVADLVLGPGQDGKPLVPDGIKASDMTPEQQALLLDVIGEWAGILNEHPAAARMAQLKADLGETWFAWSGPTDAKPGSNITAYYRIQGPHLVIEYAPQQDEPDNHVHTIYRDPTNDYGRTTAKR